MARITVEDCVTVVYNRFELCLIASSRAKNILSGSATTLNRKEKPAVIALREIADRLIDVNVVKQNIIRAINKSRGGSTVDSATQESSQIAEMIAEEISEQSIKLKDDTFVDENIQIDD